MNLLCAATGLRILKVFVVFFGAIRSTGSRLTRPWFLTEACVPSAQAHTARGGGRKSMKTTTVVLILGLATFVAALKNDGSRIALGTHTDAVEIGIILKDGDWRMNLANDCLEETFGAGQDSDTARLLRVLKLTGFSLSTVVMKETKQDPVRIRFGFEFTKPEALKTVYWETDCAVEMTPDRLPPAVVANPAP
jgi:hypothetical protein